MIRWFLENVGLMILALLIAVTVWVAAEWESDPIIENQYDQPIQVRVTNVPSGVYLVPGWEQEVRVRLKATQSVWDQLDPSDVEAVVDLSPNASPLEPGEWDVPVVASLDLEPAELLEIEPRFVRIQLEEIREQMVAVQIQIRGEPELGFQAEEPQVVPDTVSVRGPSSQVNQIVQASGSVSLQGARQTVEEDVTLVPVDAGGRRVTIVTLNPEQVRVRVPVRQRPNFKQMAVNVEILGQPAQDYRVTNVTYDPSVVSVIGSPVILDQLPGVLNTVPISIDGRSEDIVERLALELPPGVSVVNPNDLAVQVRIEVEPLPGSVTVTRTVTFQGLQPNLSAVASPDVVEVLLSGPLPRLNSLLPEDVRVILDLSGLRLGDTSQLTPAVITPEGITLDSIIPSVIQVQIVLKPTPTPTPTPLP